MITVPYIYMCNFLLFLMFHCFHRIQEILESTQIKHLMRNIRRKPQTKFNFNHIKFRKTYLLSHEVE